MFTINAIKRKIRYQASAKADIKRGKQAILRATKTKHDFGREFVDVHEETKSKVKNYFKRRGFYVDDCGSFLYVYWDKDEYIKAIGYKQADKRQRIKDLCTEMLAMGYNDNKDSDKIHFRGASDNAEDIFVNEKHELVIVTNKADAITCDAHDMYYFLYSMLTKKCRVDDCTERLLEQPFDDGFDD